MSPACFTLDSVAAATPDGRVLFDQLTLVFGRERTGLVGRNGAGKSTLLRLLTGEQAPVAGTITRVGRIGVLAQTPSPPPGATAADLLGVADDLARLARVEAGAGDEADWVDADWSLPVRLGEALVQVGLPDLSPERPAASLSGGQLTRLSLARLLVSEPDVILLDEPTNHLDAGGRALVAGFLERWRGGAVVVSHDRALLRGMDRILELSSLGGRLYGGGYDLYAARKAEERAAAERELTLAERQARQVEREAQKAREAKARRDAAGRRFAARGSEPKMFLDAQAERAEASGGRADLLADRRREAAAAALADARSQVERVRALAFDLPSSGLPAGKTLLAFEGVGFSYPDAPPLLTDLSLRLTGPERVAVSGPNGCGKSTLIRLAVGDLEPTAGHVVRGAPAVLLDQNTALLAEEETLLQAFQRLNPEASVNDAQTALARFLFRNLAVRQVVGTLSGGERLRAALACLLCGSRPPQLLILDEPSNHLDLPSLEAVEAALRGYDGALLVVSHDADFLEAIGVERTLTLGQVPA